VHRPGPDPAHLLHVDVATERVPADFAEQPAVRAMEALLREAGASPRLPLYLASHLRATLPQADLGLRVALAGPATKDIVLAQAPPRRPAAGGRLVRGRVGGSLARGVDLYRGDRRRGVLPWTGPRCYGRPAVTLAPIRRNIQALPASRIREVSLIGRDLEDVIPLWFGESDLVTPAFVREAAKTALDDGKTFVFWGRNYNTAGIPGPERSQTWVNQPENMHGSRDGAGWIDQDEPLTAGDAAAQRHRPGPGASDRPGPSDGVANSQSQARPPHRSNVRRPLS
jgi:hypothetical protein